MLSHIFLDSNGQFQWASVAAITSIITALVSVYVAVNSHLNNKKSQKLQRELNDEALKLQRELNRDNFEGNIVAKARIEWIQEVRKKSVDFISACHKLLAYMKNGNVADFKVLEELKSNVESNATLLILFFGPDKGKNKNNDFIVYLIWLISGKLLNKDGYYDRQQILKMEDFIDVLRDFLRIYFKAEWKRANKEILDEEVQKYLEEDKYYRRIMNIYKSGLTCYDEWVENFYDQLEEETNKS
ncbi:hypothetical protein QTH09_03000 [Clostridium perfringens]|uniref:hypothetical protein n=1 Tax=Clostridium perfringens TaxID=1502 RepID=UPI001CB5FD41|nr:hypothetical protein [Clostridium perfringens]MDM0609999.1 hypothetical protein [Clostridium perfringens]STB11367.1 Uncharacterised protein [Clostridium novyi]